MTTQLITRIRYAETSCELCADVRKILCFAMLCSNESGIAFLDKLCESFVHSFVEVMCTAEAHNTHSLLPIRYCV